jgi:hypothetical protein
VIKQHKNRRPSSQSIQEFQTLHDRGPTPRS